MARFQIILPRMTYLVGLIIVFIHLKIAAAGHRKERSLLFFHLLRLRHIGFAQRTAAGCKMKSNVEDELRTAVKPTPR